MRDCDDPGYNEKAEWNRLLGKLTTKTAAAMTRKDTDDMTPAERKAAWDEWLANLPPDVAEELRSGARSGRRPRRPVVVPEDARLLSMREAAVWAGIGWKAIKALVKAGGPGVVKLPGGKVRIDRAKLLESLRPKAPARRAAGRTARRPASEGPY